MCKAYSIGLTDVNMRQNAARIMMHIFHKKKPLTVVLKKRENGFGAAKTRRARCAGAKNSKKEN
jgi:hypothetical protein